MVLAAGRIVILNGAPRSGKSTIVSAIQDAFDGPWMNLGVDVFVRDVTPVRFQPGIGLRPGAERPDLESFVVASFGALYDSVAAHSRAGLNVVVDVGHHDVYSRPLHILDDAARRVAGLPVLFVGVRCPIEVIITRREASDPDRYVGRRPDGGIPDPVRRWQEAVHQPGVYDLEVDTSVLTPEECAVHIGQRLEQPARPTVFEQFAGRSATP